MVYGEVFQNLLYKEYCNFETEKQLLDVWIQFYIHCDYMLNAVGIQMYFTYNYNGI